jgi:hypothetical protein
LLIFLFSKKKKKSATTIIVNNEWIIKEIDISIRKKESLWVILINLSKNSIKKKIKKT